MYTRLPKDPTFQYFHTKILTFFLSPFLLVMQEQQEKYNPRIAMGKATKILRRSIHTFLQQFQLFTSIFALIAFPFSLSLLISQAIVSSSSSSSFSILPTIQNRIQSLFDAAGFPPSSQFFTTLTSKLSQTISSSILTLPFTLTFLLITKASIIQTLTSFKSHSFSFSSALSLYPSILLTHLCNSLLLLSTNATVFTLLFIAFGFLQGFGILISNSPKTLVFLSASGAVIYSIVVANAIVICNMALVLSGVEKSGGYLKILKACLVIRGRTSTALFLALPVSLGLAAVEALFQYRVVRVFHFEGGKIGSSMVLEGCFIAYLYSVLVVLDTVVSFMFFKSCKIISWGEISDEENGGYRILKDVS